MEVDKIVKEWIVEVTSDETISGGYPTLRVLSLSLYDRCRSRLTITKKNAQCVATACMFIAEKYTEDIIGLAKEWADLTDGAVTQSQLIEMEYTILQALDWDIRGGLVFGEE